MGWGVTSVSRWAARTYGGGHPRWCKSLQCKHLQQSTLAGLTPTCVQRHKFSVEVDEPIHLVSNAEARTLLFCRPSCIGCHCVRGLRAATHPNAVTKLLLRSVRPYITFYLVHNAFLSAQAIPRAAAHHGHAVPLAPLGLHPHERLKITVSPRRKFLFDLRPILGLQLPPAYAFFVHVFFLQLKGAGHLTPPECFCACSL